MTNAEHIVAWGMSDRELYSRAVALHRHPRPFASSLAHDALSWAADAHRGARRANDIGEGVTYSAADVIEAAALLLAYDMEL